jgi:hypothetical protein
MKIPDAAKVYVTGYCISDKESAYLAITENKRVMIIVPEDCIIAVWG